VHSVSIQCGFCQLTKRVVETRQFQSADASISDEQAKLLVSRTDLLIGNDVCVHELDSLLQRQVQVPDHDPAVN
jgi:hypothetical protein